MKFRLIEDKEKQFRFYTDGVTTIKIKDGDEVPEGFHPGRTFNSNPWNKGLSADTDERVKANGLATRATRISNGSYIPWNKGLTKEQDSRIKGLSGELNPMYGKHPTPWNLGLTKDTDERMKKASDNHKGVIAWNKGLTAETDERVLKYARAWLTGEAQKKSSDTKRKNNSFNTSKPEIAYYLYLCFVYGGDDVIHSYRDDRYPYNCDFYVKSQDLFIELDGTWTHGLGQFDSNNPEHIALLKKYEEKAKNSKYYANAIFNWTLRDVQKAETAVKNNLNFKRITYKLDSDSYIYSDGVVVNKDIIKTLEA